MRQVLFKPADAAARLRRGEVLVVPTECYYALAASVESPKGVLKVWSLKRREAQKPLALMAADVAQAKEWIDFASLLLPLTSYWPAPLTLVAKARRVVPPVCLGPTGELGVRVPNFSWIQETAGLLGCPMTATSANFAGEPPAVSISGLPDELLDGVDAVVDGGVLRGGEPSSVVGVVSGALKVFRPGAFALGDSLDKS